MLNFSDWGEGTVTLKHCALKDHAGEDGSSGWIDYAYWALNAN